MTSLSVALDGTRENSPGPRRTASARIVTSAGNFSIEIASDVAVFAKSWPTLTELEHLPDVRSYPFQCRDHLEIWQETIGNSSKVQPLFVHVSDGSGAPLMMIPLGVRTRFGVRMLSFLDEGVADYNAPLLYRGAAGLSAHAATEIWEAICRAAPPFDVAILEKMPSAVDDFANPLAVLARKPWPASGHLLRLSHTGAGEPLQSRHYEKENRRRRRRLADRGPITFNAARSDDDVNRVFDVFVRQKLQRYRETIGIEDFDVPGQRAYYRALTHRLLGRNVQLFWLAVGEEIIATAWCLSAGRHLYYMMCASERNDPWRSFSPGRLLLEDLVRWAQANGFEVFDFGIGDEDYKLHWRQISVQLYSALRPRTARGNAWCAFVAAREEMKQRLPAGLADLAKRVLGRK